MKWTVLPVRFPSILSPLKSPVSLSPFWLSSMVRWMGVPKKSAVTNHRPVTVARCAATSAGISGSKNNDLSMLIHLRRAEMLEVTPENGLHAEPKMAHDGPKAARRTQSPWRINHEGQAFAPDVCGRG